MDIREVAEHVIYRIVNTPVQAYPYPHFLVRDVFPAHYYAEMPRRWPRDEAFASQAESGRSTAGAYRDRGILPLGDAGGFCRSDPFWAEFAGWFMGERFTQVMTFHFKPWIDRSRKLPAQVRVMPDAMLVQDRTGYGLTPHTDARHRLVSSLFYCPADDSQAELGTSVYVPREGGPVPGITGRHYDRSHFVRVATAPFLPNTLFGFVVGPVSFHGVEPVTRAEARRNHIMHFIRLSDETLAAMLPENAG